MEKYKSIFFYALLALLMIGVEINGCEGNHKSSSKLFVFGDSYVDTGNLPKVREMARAWYEPYGMTFPNRPTGRFSNGRVLTDHIASVLKIKSPIPYKFRRVGSNHLSYGMNFAVAGTGVFDTVPRLEFRNLSAQIDTFHSQINENVYSESDLKSSVALVVISGNDYSHFLENGGVMQDLLPLIINTTIQLKFDLNRIHEIGIGKVVVTTLSPLGCTPEITRIVNYAKCNETAAMLVSYHNSQLLKGVHELRKASSSSSAFLVLDLNAAFMSVINQEKGVRKFKNKLKPCCDGKEGFSCGEKDKNGIKQYSLCSNPEDYFYWDNVHPSQAGWAAVFKLIRPWLTRHLL